MPTLDDLTPRQRALIDGIIAGQTYREIATHLGLAQMTVKNNLSALYRFVGVPGRAALGAWAIRQLAQPDARQFVLIHPDASRAA